MLNLRTDQMPVKAIVHQGLNHTEIIRSEVLYEESKLPTIQKVILASGA